MAPGEFESLSSGANFRHAPSEGVVRLASLNGDPTEVRELRNPSLTTEPTIAASLDAAERHLGFVSHSSAIDMADTQIISWPLCQRAIDVLTEDRRRESVLGVIRDAGWPPHLRQHA